MTDKTSPELEHTLLIESGIILEANRQFFHPLGIDIALGPDGTLVVNTADDGEEFEYGACDDEDVRQLLASSIKNFHATMENRHATRKAALGYVVQDIKV